LTHGDLKPENVLLSALPGSKEAVRARLADFGLADARASLSGASRLSTVQMTNEKRGTKPYRAPEMFREGGGVAGGGVAGGDRVLRRAAVD
jgi:serine/threonine protein kinase